MPTRPTRREWLALGGFGAAVLAAALVGSLSTIDAADRYAALEQPAWAPPSWLFGPAWTLLYATIAWAGWMVWRATGSVWSLPLRIYWLQLGLNALWSPIFFAAGWRAAALAWIVALDVVVVGMLAVFRRYDRGAALILVPYLAWILFATGLNAAVWWLNR